VPDWAAIVDVTARWEIHKAAAGLGEEFNNDKDIIDAVISTEIHQ
jgi:hypothetical protein